LRFYSSLLACLAMCSILLAILLLSMMIHHMFGVPMADVFMSTSLFMLVVFGIVYKYDRYKL